MNNLSVKELTQLGKNYGFKLSSKVKKQDHINFLSKRIGRDGSIVIVHSEFDVQDAKTEIMLVLPKTKLYNGEYYSLPKPIKKTEYYNGIEYYSLKCGRTYTPSTKYVVSNNTWYHYDTSLGKGYRDIRARSLYVRELSNCRYFINMFEEGIHTYMMIYYITNHFCGINCSFNDIMIHIRDIFFRMLSSQQS